MVNKLPDIYRKDEESNNYKLLEINKVEIDKLKEDIEAIDESLDITKAYGDTLDNYGELYKQQRGNLDDDKYRVLIQAKIENLLLDGAYENVIGALCRIFNCEASEIEIEDTGPLHVHISGLPIEAITRLGFSLPQAIAIVEQVLPVCVSITGSIFEGTFAFGEEEGETGENGLSNDAGTSGGTLSFVVSDDEQIILPI